METLGYRQKNCHQSAVNDVKSRIDTMLAFCAKHGLEFDTLVLSTAWGGVGGSPFAEKPEGNMDIRSLVRVYRKRGLDHGLNIEEMERTIQFLRQRTTREIVDIKI